MIGSFSRRVSTRRNLDQRGGKLSLRVSSSPVSQPSQGVGRSEEETEAKRSRSEFKGPYDRLVYLLEKKT